MLFPVLLLFGVILNNSATENLVELYAIHKLKLHSYLEYLLLL